MDVEIADLNKLAFEQISLGQVKKALVLLEKAKTLLSDFSSEKIKFFTIINLSSCLARLKMFKKANEELIRNLAAVQDPWLGACFLMNLAAVKCELGCYQEALNLEISALENLKQVPLNNDKVTLEACLCRNIAAICVNIGLNEQGVKYDLKAREAATGLGPSNYLAAFFIKTPVVLPESRVFQKKEYENFLKKARLLSIEKLHPMHNKRISWTKRLKHLHFIQETKELELELDQNQNLNLNLNHSAGTEPSQTLKNNTQFKTKIRYKPIKIVNQKDLALERKKNRAALTIQKNFRMFRERGKFLLYQKLGKNVEIRIENFGIFASLAEDQKN